ncbi:uncharacterized protein LOC125496472 [Beta vulgaris subsp. vulgaris]|uniref:uncharacterized protein LOC125496472 n=1 Tax=Beta vulgaris subsp. vulgaris TaxID=3555 RepID=UPI0020374B79|nr:uncharacterized protein LOC125496472 [Beta vulgaris subsp. vulgaris]
MTRLSEGTAFRSYLGRKKLTTLTEVLGMANDFIRREQFDKAAAAKRPDGDEKEKDKDKAEIYELHKKDDKWQRPKKMFYKGPDKSAWCDFHRDYGHVTNDYKDLRDDIKDSVRKGYFKQYEARTDEKSPSREDEDSSRKSLKERITEIHVISGGPAHGGSIHGAKASLKEVKHQISTVLHRILVDGGSSTNILFMDTFEKMGLGVSYLKPISYPMIGFTGTSVVSEGNIKLRLKIGEGSQSKDMMVEYLVFDVPAAYNAIIGRPLIHDAQVVVSNYHLTMIYTSNDAGKLEKIQGNQESTRACYLTALKNSNHKRPAETPLEMAADPGPGPDPFLRVWSLKFWTRWIRVHLTDHGFGFGSV